MARAMPISSSDDPNECTLIPFTQAQRELLKQTLGLLSVYSENIDEVMDHMEEFRSDLKPNLSELYGLFDPDVNSAPDC